MYTQDELNVISNALDIVKSKALTGDVIANSEIAKKLAILTLSPLDNEAFAVLFLNTQSQLIKSEVLFNGTIDRSAVYPRVIIKKALECNAASLIIAHNHPSGLVEPSSADRVITDHIKSACNLLDIRLIDHIVTGGASTFSFAEKGLL